MAETINLGKVLVTLEGEHDSTRSYDKYCEVTSGGNSYVSKKAVPIGTPITDTTYWQKRASKGADGTNGNDGADAYQPFKGWYDTSSSLSAAFPTPQVGDYAYVVGASASDPVTIYKCATAGTWAASSSTFNPANNQEFASGQSLNTVNIVDNLNSSSATDVLSAKQGKALKSKVDALGPKIYDETAVDLAYKNLSYSRESETVISPASTKSRVYYAPISQGDNCRITATHSEIKGFSYGFTSEIPVVDTQVSGAVSLDTSSVDVTVVAPISGYIVISKYATYFTDLTVSIIASKIDRLEDIVGKLSTITNSASFVGIKNNIITLKRINSDGSVTDATTTSNRTFVADVSGYVGKTLFLDGQLGAVSGNLSYCWWVFHDANGNMIEKSNTSGAEIQRYTNIPVVVPNGAVTLYVQGKEDYMPNAKGLVGSVVETLIEGGNSGSSIKSTRTFALDFGTISISRGTVATSTTYNNNACKHTVNYIRVHKSIEIKNLQNTTISIRLFFYDNDYTVISNVAYQNTTSGLTSIVVNDIPSDAVWFRLSFATDNTNYPNRVIYPRFEVEIESEWGVGEETSKAPYVEYLPFMYGVRANIPIKLSEHSYTTKSVFGYDEGLIHLPPTYTPKGKPTPLIFYIHGDAERYTMGQSTFSGHMKMQQCWSDAGFAQVDLDLIPSFYNEPSLASAGGTRDDLECLSAAWEFLVNHFNIDKRGFYLIGRSRGGQCVIEVLGKGGATKLPIIAAISMAGANSMFEYSVNSDATENEWQLWCNAHGLPTNGRPSWGSSSSYSANRSFLVDENCYNFLVNNWNLWWRKALTGWGLITKNPEGITPRDYFDNYIYPYVQANKTVTPAIEQFFEQMIETMEAKSPVPLRLDWCVGDQTQNKEYFVSTSHIYSTVFTEILLNTPASLVEYRRWPGVDASNPYGETNPHFAENMIFYDGDLVLPNGAVTSNPSKVTMEWLIWCMGKDPRYQGINYTLPWQ